MNKHEDYLLGIIKCQQEIINKYKEYIENMIHKKIIENVSDNFSPFSNNLVSFKHISIPETHIAIKCDPWVLREWDYLKMETPILDYNKIIAISQEIKENEIRKANSN